MDLHYDPFRGRRVMFDAQTKLGTVITMELQTEYRGSNMNPASPEVAYTTKRYLDDVLRYVRSQGATICLSPTAQNKVDTLKRGKGFR